MKKKLEPKNIEQLMVEADELIRKINSDFIKEMKEERRLELEKHTLHLKKIKTEVQDKIDSKETSEIGSGAQGMHAAIDEMVKAMTALKNYLF
jgi:hypothetical protein